MNHSLLIGGIGGDSHSVGLNILKMALTSEGFNVTFKGVQNNLLELMEIADHYNLVLISNMDGHARHYLSNFYELKISLIKNHLNTIFYLGGNLSIGSGATDEKYFMEMGFDRVYPKFVDIKEVINTIKCDLKSKPVKPGVITENKYAEHVNNLHGVLSEVDFSNQRKQVLQHWPIGKDIVDIGSNTGFLKKVPNFSNIIHGKKTNRPLIQPRSGVGSCSGQLDLLSKLQLAGADCLSHQIDSFTRNNNYQAIKDIIDSKDRDAINTLNGFPLINHPLSCSKNLTLSLNSPLQVRHSTKDPRLLAEVSYAVGATGFEGGAICYNIPYYKNYSLVDSLNKWDYVDKLTGEYFYKYNIILDREFFGCLTATLIPPSLAITVNLLQSILAAENNVQSLSLGFAETGCRFQDIAAIRTLKSLVTNYLENLGYKNLKISTAFYQYMAAFPPSPEQSISLIYNSAATAFLANADRILTKTPVEAINIPTLQDNIHGMNIVSDAFRASNTFINQELNEKVNSECKIIEEEVNQLFSAVLMIGNGDLREGIVRSFEKGIIDIPFSPSQYNKGLVTTIRDNEGAIRILDFGNLPFSSSLKNYHKDRVRERNHTYTNNKTTTYELILHDVIGIAKGGFKGWPLDTVVQ